MSFPTSSSIQEILDGTVVIVEANSFERHTLWQNNQNRALDSRLNWESENSGQGMQANLHGRPVCFTLWPAWIEGKKIIFWEATSQLVDYKMITDWFDKNLPDIRRYDANNFHNAVAQIKQS